MTPRETEPVGSGEPMDTDLTKPAVEFPVPADHPSMAGTEASAPSESADGTTSLGFSRSTEATALPESGDPSTDRRGSAGKPQWELPAFIALLVLTAVLYVWDLAASGYANAFYSAAAQAGGKSWWAFLWGASDMGASITVDKPPASIWVMALSVRLFGLSSWSVLAPQALIGVATVAVVYRVVRRYFSASAALISGTVLALTPVAALMFRFNNPDALLVLLMVAAVWATMRAVDGPHTTRWMVLAGAFVGFAFLTKQLQAFLILPGLATAYLWAAPVSPWRRVRDGLAAVGAMVLAGGWWVALVELWPSGSRPYVGGSQTDSFLELTFGYNGLGRITGDETGSVGGGGPTGAMWGDTGIGRLFGGEIGGQIAWLLPAALIFAVVLFWATRRAPRSDGRRAQVVVWTAWLLITAVTFSFMAGIFHAYYTVALAPAIAALVGIGAAELWGERKQLWTRITLAVTTLLTAGWAVALLGRSPDFLPWLTPLVLVAGLVGAALLIWGSRVSAIGAGAALVAGLAGPTAYAIDTVGTAHTGSLVTAGPVSDQRTEFPAGVQGPEGQFPGAGPDGQAGPSGQQADADGQAGAPSQQPNVPGQAGADAAGQPQSGQSQGGAPNQSGGAFGQGQPRPDGTGGGSGQGNAPSGRQGSAQVPPGVALLGGPGGGGLIDGASVSAELSEMLSSDGSAYRWVAAVSGSQNAASYQLATGMSVMPIGGFNGSDPSPTLAQFQVWVAAGEIHYYIGSGLARSQSGSDTAGQIGAWVAENFTSTTVDGLTVYDLAG